MFTIKVSEGTTISKESEKKGVAVGIERTNYVVLGELEVDNSWTVYLVNKDSSEKNIFRRNLKLLDFKHVVEKVLKVPFPWVGKESPTFIQIENFLKEIIKNKKHGNKRKRSN